MPSASPGDLILFADRTDCGVARVDLVRERHYSAFPWRNKFGLWDRRRFRIQRWKVLAVLPATADPEPIADQLNVYLNQCAGEKASAQARFMRRVQGLAKSLDVVREDA